MSAVLVLKFHAPARWTLRPELRQGSDLEYFQAFWLPEIAIRMLSCSNQQTSSEESDWPVAQERVVPGSASLDARLLGSPSGRPVEHGLILPTAHIVYCKPAP